MSNDESTAVEARDPHLDKDPRVEAMTRLSDGLGSRDPFLIVTGDDAADRAGVVREVIERWGPRARAALVSARAGSETGFLEGIIRGFGLEPPAHASKAQLRDRLERVITESEGKGRIPVIVVEDAHDLSAEFLGELQILSNASLLGHRPLEVILVGGPSLDTMLAGPAFESIRSRIGFQCRLDSLSLQATRRYLHELSTTTSEGGGFISRKAAREIFKRTEGIPEAVRALALAAMDKTRAAGARTVTSEHVATAAAATARAKAPAPAPPPQEAPVPAAAETIAAAEPPVTPTVVPERPARPTKPSAPPESSNAEQAMKRAAEETPAQPAPQSMPRVLNDALEGENDPRVKAWVARFIKPDEPRFGEILRGLGPMTGQAPDEIPVERTDAIESGAADPSDVEAAEATLKALRARKAREHEGRGRSTSSDVRSRQTIYGLSILLVIMTTAVVVLVLRQVRSTSRVESASSIPAAPAPKESVAVAPPKKAASPPPAPAAPPADRFAVDVGTYTDRDLAEAERDRIVADTKLRGWIVEGSGDQSGSYRVILGVYSTRARATTSAGRLIQAGLASEATVITLPLRKQRR